jgi:hypothetical protein
MKRLIVIAFASILLLGCASNPLDIVSAVTGSKPDMTAQVGATNTKQAVGLTANTDASNETDATVKDSTVGSLDSSSGKKLSATSISAGIIKADTIQITNASSESGWQWLAFGVAFLIVAGLVIHWIFQRKKAP